MKRFFTILILSGLIVGTTSQCSEKSEEPIVETIYTVKYILKNNTTKEIMIRCYDILNINYYYDIPKEIITIAPGKEHTESYSYIGGGFAKPFFKYYVLYIEDGEYRIINRKAYTEGLFVPYNYTLKTDRKAYREYVFTFNDDFFIDGEPVEDLLK